MKTKLAQVTNRNGLKSLQKAFFQIISRPLRAKDKMLSDPRVEDMIADSQALSAHERLELYAQQYWWRIIDSLADDFQGVAKVLGKKRFFALLVRYMTRFKSRSYTLRHLGDRLERFIRADRELPTRLRALAADVAALEWAQMEVFESEEAPPITPADIASRSFARFKFTTQPYLRLLVLQHSADDWVSEGRDDFLRDAASNVISKAKGHKTRETKKRATKAETFIAVYRIGDSIRFRRLTPIMFALLSGFVRGGTINQIISGLLRKEKRLSGDQVLHAFREFASLGWLCRQKKDLK